MGFVRGAASQFRLTWATTDDQYQDATLAAAWTCSHFEESLCTIEAFVDDHSAQVAALFPASWGVSRVLLLVVLKEARRSLDARLSELAPRVDAIASDLLKMHAVAQEFESVCDQRYPPPLVELCSGDGSEERGPGRGGVAEWKREEARGLSRQDMLLKGALSSAFALLGVSAAVHGTNLEVGGPIQTEAAAVFELGDLEDTADGGDKGVGPGGRGVPGDDGGYADGFWVGQEWGACDGADESPAGTSSNDVGLVLKMERWGAGLAMRQTDLGFVSMECLLLSTGALTLCCICRVTCWRVCACSVVASSAFGGACIVLALCSCGLLTRRECGSARTLQC